MSTAPAILKPSTLSRRLHLLLRLGIAACFIGHGAFGILQKEAWLPFFELVGIGPAAAFTLMPLMARRFWKMPCAGGDRAISSMSS